MATVRSAPHRTHDVVNQPPPLVDYNAFEADPTIRQDAELAAEWEPRLTLPDYDRYAQAGMVMTEKQGGSDLRANTTVAEPIGDGWYELTGHKWFCTHPVFDMFFTLAQAPGGITCFVAERPHPGFRLQRLKDKLGGRCLASAAVDALLGECEAARGADARLDAQLDRCRAALADLHDPQFQARALVEDLAL